MNPNKTSKDRCEEVRWRIDMWNARVERVQSITILTVRRHSRDLTRKFVQKKRY
jgi:hypothetical protein